MKKNNDIKKIGIVGSRRRNSEKDYQKIKRVFLREVGNGDIVITGGCREGADYFAEILIEQFNVQIVIFKPEWTKYGRIATFMRNTQIASISDVLIACVAIDRKGGTEDTIKKFKKFHPKGKLIFC